MNEQFKFAILSGKQVNQLATKPSHIEMLRVITATHLDQSNTIINATWVIEGVPLEQPLTKAYEAIREWAATTGTRTIGLIDAVMLYEGQKAGEVYVANDPTLDDMRSNSPTRRGITLQTLHDINHAIRYTGDVA